MRPILTLFKRRVQGKRALAIAELVEGCEWVLAGEGVATEKWDGTACLVLGGVLYRRMRAKQDAPKPRGWIHWSQVGEGKILDEAESDSGHGWVPVDDVPADRWHREAWAFEEVEGREPTFEDGTYELVGPAIQSNPYGLHHHQLWRHGTKLLCEGHLNLSDSPTLAYMRLADLFATMRPMEGIVWHHPDGRMAKIKRRDFGLPWPVKAVKE